MNYKAAQLLSKSKIHPLGFVGLIQVVNACKCTQYSQEVRHEDLLGIVGSTPTIAIWPEKGTIGTRIGNTIIVSRARITQNVPRNLQQRYS